MPDLKDATKEKFRPTADAAIDAQLDEELGDLDLDDLYGLESADTRGRLGGAQVGTVIEVDKGNNDVMVDLGGKNQGLVPLDAFDAEPKIGAEIEVEVERFDPHESLYILRRKGDATANVDWSSLRPGSVVEGMVEKKNKGGLEIKVGQIRAFMPAGQVDTEFHEDLQIFVGQKLKAEVTKVDRAERNLLLSRRVLLEREQAVQREKLMEELDVDQIRRGTVKRVTEFGAFVDLGGIDGLLHVSEMGHNRHAKAADLVKVGDLVDVKIVKFDPETGRMSLSLKALMADPWANAEANYPVGSAVTGRVTKLETFGAFVEVDEGLEGLLPVSEISWQRINHPRDVVSEGQMLRVVVLSVDPLEKRMSLSLKQAGADPWAGVEARYPKHAVVPGKVTRVMDFGAFTELEPGLEGLIHVSELSDRRIRNAGDVVRPGQEVNVRVLDVDPETRRLSLSLKQAVGTTPTETPAVASDVPAEKRKPRPNLRGGLEF